jgi:hypothetical protein
MIRQWLVTPDRRWGNFIQLEIEILTDKPLVDIFRRLVFEIEFLQWQNLRCPLLQFFLSTMIRHNFTLLDTSILWMTNLCLSNSPCVIPWLIYNIIYSTPPWLISFIVSILRCCALHHYCALQHFHSTFFCFAAHDIIAPYLMFFLLLLCCALHHLFPFSYIWHCHFSSYIYNTLALSLP